MIIKLTFKDNDFTHILEDYTNKIFDITYFNSISEFTEFKNNIKKYENDILTRTEIQELKEMLEKQIRKNCKKYLEKQNSSDYLIRALEVKIVKAIEDKWHNGEVVYYFTSNMKYLTMLGAFKI